MHIMKRQGSLEKTIIKKEEEEEGIRKSRRPPMRWVDSIGEVTGISLWLPSRGVEDRTLGGCHSFTGLPRFRANLMVCNTHDNTQSTEKAPSIYSIFWSLYIF